MAQFRMMTILLFACLSLCFKVAQSELKNIYSPCMNNAECKNRCCYRYSWQKDGICVLDSFTACYGPRNGNGCYHSNECYSECCHTPKLLKDARCIQKELQGQKCIGPNIGDLCAINTKCSSKCCRLKHFSTATAGVCEREAEENEPCDYKPYRGVYLHYCPCASGLICMSNKSRRVTGTCKKPNTTNNCI